MDTQAKRETHSIPARISTRDAVETAIRRSKEDKSSTWERRSEKATDRLSCWDANERELSK